MKIIERIRNWPYTTVIFIILQIINIQLSGFGTGTQGSYDPYLESVIIGLILGIVIIIFNKNQLPSNKAIAGIFGIMVLFNIILLYIQIPYIKYVIIKGRRISSVISDIAYLNIDLDKASAIERLLPILIDILILENIGICIRRISKVRRKET